jgi:hypothetical protein
MPPAEDPEGPSGAKLSTSCIMGGCFADLGLLLLLL